MGIRYYINRRTSLQAISKILYFFDLSSHKEFNDNYKKYKKIYLKYKRQHNNGDHKWVLPMWRGHVDGMEKYFLNEFEYSFLRHPIIRENIFVNINKKLQKAQMEYLTEMLGKEKLAKLLPESTVGNPTITNFRFKTSHNTIHHLHHLVKFSQEADVKLEKIQSVTEWGGGYGNFARIFLRINPEVTYTVIDLPIFSFIQALYLSTIFGYGKINLITNISHDVQKGKINIIPLNKEVLENLIHSKTDLFVSTWALSESSEYAQNFIKSSSFFNASYLLLAHQENSQQFPFAEGIAKDLNSYNITYHKKIPLLKNNYYLFCKRKQGD